MHCVTVFAIVCYVKHVLKHILNNAQFCIVVRNKYLLKYVFCEASYLTKPQSAYARPVDALVVEQRKLVLDNGVLRLC